MADTMNSADSAPRLDPRPSPTMPPRRLRRDMTARVAVPVSAQV